MGYHNPACLFPRIVYDCACHVYVYTAYFGSISLCAQRRFLFLRYKHCVGPIRLTIYDLLEVQIARGKKPVILAQPQASDRGHRYKSSYIFKITVLPNQNVPCVCGGNLGPDISLYRTVMFYFQQNRRKV